MANDEIVFEGHHLNLRYDVAWPGDESYEKSNSKNSEKALKAPSFTMNNKKPMEPNQKTPYIKLYDSQLKKNPNPSSNNEKLPGSMKNRYFSSDFPLVSSPSTLTADEIKSKIEKSHGQILEDDLIIPTDQVVQPESEAFIKRRDYLLTKLLKAHTLPGLDETPILPQKEDEKITIISRPPVRESTFQEEYIPLFAKSETTDKKSDSSKSTSSETDDDDDCDVQIVGEKKYDPKVNTLENYRGPYPIDCLYRSRRIIIEEFMPNSKATNRSNFFDRRFEILKMKLEVVSKFDKDKRLWNKIRRQTVEKRQEILDKISANDRRFNYYLSTLKSPKKNQKIVFTTDSDSYEEYTKEVKPSTSKDVIKLVSKKKRNKDEMDTDTEDSDEDNEADVINMINQPEYCINLSDDGDEEDSKCKQFDKYTTSKSKKGKLESKVAVKQKNSKKKQLKSDPNFQLKKSKEQKWIKGVRVDRVGLAGTSSDKEYEELKERYKKVRNKRNKALRKKKGVEIEIERKIMSDELKSIRAALKKLRRKKKFTLDIGELYNPLEMVKNKDSKKPKTKQPKGQKETLTNKKKEKAKKKLNNKRFNREFKKGFKNGKTNKVHAGRYFENFLN